MACYLEGLLSPREKTRLDQHLTACASCQENLQMQMAVADQQRLEGVGPVSQQIIERAQNLVSERFGLNMVDVIINFSGQIFESLKTSGEIILGPSTPLTYKLRSKPQENAKMLVVHKKTKALQLTIEIAREKKDLNTVILKMKDSKNILALDGLRVSLLECKTEIESHPTQKGKVIFQGIQPGRYTIQIFKKEKPLMEVSLQLIQQ